MKVYPDHLATTNRAWKQRKRREWQAVLKAFNTFRLGCAYTPSYDQHPDGNIPIVQLETAMQDITADLSFKKWGR